MSTISPNLLSVTNLLADTYAPLDQRSKWYCDNPYCSGDPHPGWEWGHCRVSQRPPDSDWFVWLLLSGRGFGKSRCAAEWLLNEVKDHPHTEWGVVAPTSEATRKCAEDLRAGLYNIAPTGFITKYNRTLGDLYINNGSIIHLISADKPDRLRGYNLAGAWADELSSWRYPDTWHLGLIPTLRDVRVNPKIVVTTTPKPGDLLRSLIKEEVDGLLGSVVVTRGSTYDNAKNLAPRFLAEVKARYEGTRMGRQEIYGEMLDDVDGALVTIDMIDETRLRDRPEIYMTRIVIAVDPATTSGEDSDETGIVVCAKGADGRGYILADLSCRESPDGWAQIVAKAYEDFQADRVVAEKNQGGDMVEKIIRSVHPNIAYKGVNAKIGKQLRAEPVAALYEQGKVSHVGVFDKLEDQWTTWVPGAKGQSSPDRVDALVHGITELGLVGLPGVHVKEFMEMEHPPCHACGTPSPKGTPQCPKCGATINIEDQSSVQEVTETEQSSFSLGSFGPSTVKPSQTTQKVLEILRTIDSKPAWQRRWR